MTSTNKHQMSKKRFYQQLLYEEFCTTGQRNHNLSQGLTSRAAFLTPCPSLSTAVLLKMRFAMWIEPINTSNSSINLCFVLYHNFELANSFLNFQVRYFVTTSLWKIAGTVSWYFQIRLHASAVITIVITTWRNFHPKEEESVLLQLLTTLLSMSHVFLWNFGKSREDRWLLVSGV